MRPVVIATIALLAACTSEASPSTPQDPASRRTTRPSVPPPPSTFAKFVPVGEDSGRFETAITTYANGKGSKVSLISAIHIADNSHYEELQREFESYDALLYELVAPESVRPQPGDERSSGFIGMIQRALQTGLELSFQLDSIDYTPDNFVHADLTPRGFEEAMEERGESLISIIFDMMEQEAKAARERAEEAGEEPPEKFDIVSAFRSGEGRHRLRMLVAKQLTQIEGMLAGAGEDGTTLLEGRNDRAIEVLREQLADGKRDLAIYYGAAHMPDLEEKILELGFEKTGERWLLAWDITKREDPKRGGGKK